MQGTFLTETKEIKDEKDDEMVVIRRRHIRSMSEIVRNIDEKRKKNNAVQEKFLSYLINEKTYFADFEKIKQHYQDRIIENYKNYNRNNDIIREKKKEHQDIINAINQELLKHLQLKHEDLTNLYDNEINALKAKIRLREHELDCYNNSYKRLYKTNYLLKKRYEEIMKIQVLNDQQFEQYSIMKNHTMLIINKKNKMLSQMRNFNDVQEMTYTQEIQKKTARFNELEYQVMMIKEETAQAEKKLKHLTQEKILKKNQIKERKIILEKMSKEYFSLYYDYIYPKSRLIQIFNSLKVKNLDEIIFKFNQNIKNYNTLKSLFSQANRGLCELNNDYTVLNQEKVEIDKKIQKQEREISLKRGKMTEEEYFSMLKGKVNKEKTINKNISKRIKEIEEISTKIFIKLVDYTQKIERSLAYSKNTPVISFLPFFSNKNLSSNPVIKEFARFNTLKCRYDLNILAIKSEGATSELFLFLTKLMSNLTMKLFIITSNVFDDILTEAPQANKMSPQFVHSYRDPEMVAIYYEELRDAENKIENKKKFIKEKRSSIMSLMSIQSPIPGLLSSQAKQTQPRIRLTTTGEELYNNYIDFAKSPYSSGNTTSRYIHEHPRRSIMIMNKYANELVYSKKPRNTFRNRTTFSPSSTNYLTNDKNDEPTKPVIPEEKIINGNEVEDKSDAKDEEEYNGNQSKKKCGKKKSYSHIFMTKNPEMDRIYMRMNDLRKLSLHYSKDNDFDSTTFNKFSQEFNKRYAKHNLKLNFLPKKKKKTNLPYVNKVLHTSQSTIDYSHKSLSRNRSVRRTDTFDKHLSSSTSRFNPTSTTSRFHKNDSMFHKYNMMSPEKNE